MVPRQQCLEEGWPGPEDAMAAVLISIDNTELKRTNWIFRVSLGEVSFPLQRLKEDKTMRVTIDLKDLSTVKFPTKFPTCSN